MTKSAETATEITMLLRARNPLIWVVTREEARVEGHVITAATAANYKTRIWDVAGGLYMSPDATAPIQGSNAAEFVLGKIMDASKVTERRSQERGVWIMRGLPVWMEGLGGATLLRMLQNLIRKLPYAELSTAQAIVIISPSNNVPAEISSTTTVIDWALPDREEIAELLQASLDTMGVRASVAVREAAIDAAVGLTGEEASACFSKSLVTHRRIDPLAISKEKRRVIARDGLIEWFDPLPGGLDAVGGLDVLKAWIARRKLAYTKEARDYGLRKPKGSMFVGVSGCGKSLMAKATATALEVPLLRLDLGRLKAGLVGESEKNIRKVFEVIAAIGRCIVWLDEIEKALQGATSGSIDGGVSSDALGALLTWMQERQGEAFVIATANDVSSLPPEFLRAGRFDVVWFVDLPNSVERVEVLKATLRAAGRADLEIDYQRVADACKDYTGAEIDSIVPDAMFSAFEDGGREITTEDLLEAADHVVPLNKTKSEAIEKLRKWVEEGRARRATSLPGIIVGALPRRARAVDLTEE